MNQGSSNAGALGNAKDPFIAIIPKSSLVPSGSPAKVPSIGEIELFDI